MPRDDRTVETRLDVAAVPLPPMALGQVYSSAMR